MRKAVGNERLVEVSKRNRTTHAAEPEYEGLFHGWGTDFEEFGDGAAVGVTAAIVEKQDGSCELVSVELLRFLPTVDAKE